MGAFGARSVHSDQLISRLALLSSTLTLWRIWLINLAGAVRLMVLIKLAEQRLDGTSDESIKMDDHVGRSDSSEDTESFDFAGSDPELYQSLLEICRTEAWVGPITGFLKFWRYDPITVDISMQGTRVVCSPYMHFSFVLR